MNHIDKGAAIREVRWQAHQNSNSEAPENTMTSIQYAWDLGGIPEIDIRQTADGIIVGFHDATPKRTTTAPEAYQDTDISELTYAQLHQWDAGVKFGQRFQGEKVPALEQVLVLLANHPEREVYLDYKQVDLTKLAELLHRYKVEEQIIFAHNDHENCKTIKRLVPEIRTMLWIPGRVPETTVQKVASVRETGFDSLDIIQLHLVDAEEKGTWRYRLERSFVQETYQQLKDAGLELEVLPYGFDRDDLFDLLHMGIRRYAIDEPKVFTNTLQLYANS
ncbi:glycerophosphodiester phosphodiesterase [Paenibacillus cremeus]|uniref:Glycerophosphodiester phosphodiesterase family protein n=1 Tax=Paenibacillus cremeus TaxID=2163881 RepID=A0A559KG93_9BACL|nr:glycerophosphodiester phosphodiesterase family protein [Paenibacillus cremeus]TVY11141.1 glycerophosphodiester phosphodiesterase family protein [Paenibacillus cremeus]